MSDDPQFLKDIHGDVWTPVEPGKTAGTWTCLTNENVVDRIARDLAVAFGPLTPTVWPPLAVKLDGSDPRDDGTMRTYPGGATRDTAENKPVYWRFTSALVEKRYGAYMHAKRIQSDGQLRDGDNWKNGIPIEDYFDSMSRHVNDLKLIREGFPGEATDPDIVTVLCAIRFNVEGMLHETLKAKIPGS
jgi:hypothetical protein